MSGSSRKVRASVGVTTVEGDEDDDNMSAGYSVSSSVSGASLIGTGQGAPSYCEITTNLCRAVTTSVRDGHDYLCAKADTCGSKGHSSLRASPSRGRVGYYKVAGYKKATQEATRVFANSRLSRAEYLDTIAVDRAANRRATGALFSALAGPGNVDAPDQATHDLLMSPGVTTRRTAHPSLKKAPVEVLTPQDAITESYSLLGDSLEEEEEEEDDDTVESLPLAEAPRTPAPTRVGLTLDSLEAEHARLAVRSAEVAEAMKNAMTAAGTTAAASRTTPIIENRRCSATKPPPRQVHPPSAALPPRAAVPPPPPAAAVSVEPPVVRRTAPPSSADPEIMMFLLNQVQALQAKLDAATVSGPGGPPAPVAEAEIPPEPRSPAPPAVSTKVYAVARGRDATSPGIYATWAGASPHVHGVSNAVFMKCADEYAGQKFIQDFLDNQPPVAETPVPVPDPVERRVNFDVPGTNASSAAGVGFGVDISSGTGTDAFGVRTNLGKEMLTKLAPESMTVAQRARLGEQILDSVAQPGMSFNVESDATMVEAFTDAVEGLTVAVDKRTAGSALGGHKDGHWRKTDHVSLKKVVDVETLQDHMEALQSAQKADLELTKTAIEEVYTHSGFSPAMAEHLALTGGIFRVSVDTYAFYIALHIHLLSLALKSGFPAAKLELDYHVKKLVLIRKRLPSRLQVMMANYTYLRDLMRTGWSCLALELLHRKAIQESMAALLNPQGAGAPGLGPPPAVNEPCGWCGSGLHGYNQPVNSCPWKPKSRTQAKTAAREAMRNLARGVAYAPPAEGA
jgi:hypothetical protein